MNTKKNSFFQPRTLIAISLVMLIWGFWQSRMQKKYGNSRKKTQIEKTKAESLEEHQQGKSSPKKTTSLMDSATVHAETKSNVQQGLIKKKEKIWIYDKENLRVEISSLGMGIKSLQLKKYVDSQKKIVFFKPYTSDHFTDFSIAIATSDISKQIEVPYFEFEESSSNQSSRNNVKGTATLGNLEIVREIIFDEDKYTIVSKTQLRNKKDHSLPSIYFFLTEKEIKTSKQSLFNPNFQYQNAIIKHKKDFERTSFSKMQDNQFYQVDYIAFESQYFVKTILNRGDLYPNAKSFRGDEYAQIQLLYKPEGIKSNFHIINSMYIGPKYMDLLKDSDKRLSSLVDYGFFDSLAKPMLFLLKWFYNFIKNWGVAIILLTLFVRILLMPLNIFSYKSMQSMQTIQPLIKEIREKHKGDNQKINQEMMLLMRQHKVNPLGGCLPILFQFPVFIALYQVLGRSIELYQSPFFGWIQDLSLKDPFYILPILMGASMFIQQKITPTTMDPMQAKIFMIIPIFFTFLMLNLPSGLTLYIFVSTLFGIIQQFFLMKKTKTT